MKLICKNDSIQNCGYEVKLLQAIKIEPLIYRLHIPYKSILIPQLTSTARQLIPESQKKNNNKIKMKPPNRKLIKLLPIVVCQQE